MGTELQASSRGQEAVIQAQVEDLERELRAVKKKERWHFAWALTGVSPVALIFAVGLFLHGNYGLVIPVVLLVAFWQFFLGVKAAGEAARLKRALEDLRHEEWSAG
ncbi:MAG: hypothetical protein PVJ76_13055 [Gemmatimonadota bacterium]|jgi:hypothetical protein